MSAWPSLGDATRQALIDRAQANPTIDADLQRLLDAWPTLRSRERSLIVTTVASAERRARSRAAP